MLRVLEFLTSCVYVCLGAFMCFVRSWELLCSPTRSNNIESVIKHVIDIMTNVLLLLLLLIQSC